MKFKYHQATGNPPQSVRPNGVTGRDVAYDTFYAKSALCRLINVATQTKTPGIPAALIAQQVDELGDITKTLSPMRPLIAREEALRKAIRGHFAMSPPALAFEAAGERYTVAVGPRALERSINYLMLVKRIGLKLYASIAKVTLKDLEANLPADVVSGVVSSANTGSRSLTVCERGARGK